MRTQLLRFSIFSLLCMSCVKQNTERSIAGIYVREYSREMLNQQSGDKLGMRTVRDTIYIKATDSGFRVENSKWTMNDYDNNGWQNQEHGDAGPLPSFDASFDNHSNVLKAEGNAVPAISIATDGRLSIGKSSEIAFTKVK